MLGLPQETRDVTIPKYSTWRAQTGQLLHLIHGSNGAYTSGSHRENLLADKMMHTLGRYSSCTDASSLKQGFISIIEKAAALARVMAQSHSRYVILPKLDKNANWYGQKFNLRWMEVGLDDNPKNSTSLVISPALVKYTISPEDSSQIAKIIFKARMYW